MKDPTIPPPDKRKKIMFYESEERQTELRIRCNFDGITQSQFFRMMITGYINHDESIFAFLDRCKQRYQIQGQQKRKKIDQIQKSTSKVNDMFALKDGEIKNIFDMIEEETNL